MKSISKHSLLLLLSFFVAGTVCAAGGVVKSPTGTAPDRYVYYPGTEELAKDEIRLISCGTGLPAARRDQAATWPLATTSSTSKAPTTTSCRACAQPTMDH